MTIESRIEKHRKQIFENIDLSKQKGLRKVSAILAIQDEEKDKIEKELMSILLNEGYRVSITQGEFKILTIEW